MLATEKEFLYSRLQFLIEKYSSWMKMKDPQENDEHFGNLHEIRQDMEKLKEYLESVPAETLVIPQGELLPCPFCMGEAAFGTMRFGCETVKQQKWEQETFHFINCIKCGANNKCLERGYTTKEKAAEHWNTRYDKHNKFIEFNKWLNTVY